MTPPGLRLISACAIAAQLATVAGPVSPAAASPLAARSSVATARTASASVVALAPDRSFLIDPGPAPSRRSIAPRPALALDPVPFPSLAPDPLSISGGILRFGAEDPAEPAGAGSEDQAVEPLTPRTGAIVEDQRPERAAWWVWTGSAALVGLFIAGFAHDLSNGTGPPPEEPELPYFPDTP